MMETHDSQIENTHSDTVIDGDLKLNDMEMPRINAPISAQERICSKRTSVAYLAVKRGFDFLSSFVVSIILLIPLAVLALLVVIKDFGNPFYVQKRVGQNGKELLVANLRWMKSWCMAHKEIGYFDDLICTTWPNKTVKVVSDMTFSQVTALGA